MLLLKRIGLAIVGLLILLALALTVAHATRSHEQEQITAETPPAKGWSFAPGAHGKVHYQLEGPAEGPLIVLVHGFSIPAYIWDPTFAYLSSRGHRVLRFDLYGRGLSSRPDIDYDMDDYVRQLDALLEYLQINEPVKLVGLSMGGAVVAHYIDQHPEKVERFALLAPLVKTPVQPRMYPLLIPGLGEIVAEVALVPAIRNGLANAVYDPQRFPDWEQKLATQTRYQGFSLAIQKTAKTLHDKDFTRVYASIGLLNKPALLVWGRDDKTLPFEDHSLLLEHLDPLIFHALDQCGHLPHYEHPEQVNAWLGDFLN